MPIVSEKSNLKANYQETLIPPAPTPKKPIPNPNQGVNYFTDTNAKGFIKNKGSSRDTNFIIGSNTITKANVIDSRGNVTLPFNENKKFKIDGSHNSRLLNLHTTDNYLNNLYGEAKGSGRLAARGKENLFFNQPFVIRDIGDRWGKYDSFGLGDSKFGNKIESIIKLGGGLIDSIGGAVLGRNPTDYVGNAIGSLERTGKFLATQEGLGFLAKQSILMSRNAQKTRTDVRYGVFDDPNSLANGDSLSAGNLFKQSQNPRFYNPLSLGSLPGITKISILAIDPKLALGSFLDSIAGAISQGALNLAEAVSAKVVDLGKGALAFAGSALGAVGSKLPKVKLPKSPFKGFKKPKLDIPAVKEVVEAVDEKAKKIANVIQESGVLSKGKAQLFDVNAFSGVGADRVNLIPYGQDNENGKSYKELDFIPFKFTDRSGKHIVFRAILSGITDTFSPEYASERYVGRPDNVYVYQGTQREISFTIDIMPKSDRELVTLWEKMNYLAGLTYPEWSSQNGGGQGMIAPFCKLTIGDMYKDTSGYISSLSFSVQDNGTWETTFAKLPKYIQASVGFTYIGDRLPSSTQKHFELPWVGETNYQEGLLSSFLGDVDPSNMTPENLKSLGL